MYISQIPEGKDAYLSALNNDKMNYKIKNAFFNAFDKEMKTIQRMIYGLPEYELYMTTPETKDYNWLGSSLKKILCKYENDILQVTIKTLTRLGIEVALCLMDVWSITPLWMAFWLRLRRTWKKPLLE
jgi:primase-polymerase (primpol)-like protein